MKEQLKSMLKNLPQGLFFNEKENDLYTFCNDCNNKISYEIRQRNIKEGPFYCRSCAQKHKKFSKQALINISNGVKKRTGEGKCYKCGKLVEFRSASGLCNKCQAISSNNIINNLISSGNCTICGVFNNTRDQNGRGKDGKENGGCNCSYEWYIKHNNQENMILHSLSNLDKINNTCLLENIKSISDYINYKKNVSLQNRLINILKFKLQNDKFKEIQNKDFKENSEWINLFNEIDNNKIINFNWYLTYRTSKDSWKGNKNKFEQSLLDNNITYFTYIKFYVNKNKDNKIYPLVVGISATLDINQTGSDLNFSTNINDGPARRFLKENNFEWYYDGILICKCNSREESRLIEAFIHDKYGLYYS